jgi:TolB-like protein
VSNAVQEDNKTLEVAMGKPTDAALGPPSVHTITIIDTDTHPTVTVVPFFNESGRKNAGDIMMLHFINQLVQTEKFKVVEPGVLRQKFLAMRVIMHEGIDTPETYLISTSLHADLILTGKVLDYQDPMDPADIPKVDFLAAAIESKSRKMIWSAKSYKQGDEGVVFFDAGKMYTANRLAAELGGVVRDLLSP